MKEKVNKDEVLELNLDIVENGAKKEPQPIYMKLEQVYMVDEEGMEYDRHCFAYPTMALTNDKLEEFEKFIWDNRAK